MRLEKNWWVGLALAVGLMLGLLVLVIAFSPRMTKLPVVISNDALLTAEANFSPEEIQRILAQRGSPLAGYSEQVGDQTLTAAQLFWAAAQNADFGLSPKALLATLQLETGLKWSQPDGLYTHLKQMALELNRGYQAGQSAQPEPAVGEALPRDTAATYALARYLAPSAKVAGQARATLQEWSDTYTQFFGQQPVGDGGPKAPATNVPFMRLPFDEPAGSFYPIESYFDHFTPGQVEESNLARFDGFYLPGAHYSGCWRGVTCYSGHNATDYTVPMLTPLYAVAAGKVIYRLDAEGGVIVDHGNGYRTLYWHMEKIVVNWQQDVKDGQLLGYSGTRGISTHPHLHFGLRLTSLSMDVDPYGWWSKTADPWPAPSKFMWRGGMTADDLTAQTHLFYEPYWTRDTRGFGSGSWYTLAAVQPGASVNWGIWGTSIAQAGTYKVSAYWPKTAENTTAAVYQVWHAGGMTPVTVNQRSDGDRFVLLGSFSFNEGPIAVILTDYTPKGAKDQRVYFDAVRWEPAQPQLKKVYFPWFYSDGKPERR